MEALRRGIGSKSLLLAPFLIAGCSHAYRETGVLLHEDARYELVRNPQDLFPELGADLPEAELVIDGRALAVERNYLRYRVVVGTRYYTVHERGDLLLRVPPGFYRIAVQPIEISMYVSGQTIRYGDLEMVELRLAHGDRMTMVLRPGGQKGIRAQLVPGRRTGVN